MKGIKFLMYSQLREIIFVTCVSLDTNLYLGSWKRTVGSQEDLRLRSQKTLFPFSSLARGREEHIRLRNQRAL